MKSSSPDEKEHILKLNETALYDIGYEHVNIINEETDTVLEKYSDVEIPDSMNNWFDKFNEDHEKKRHISGFRRRLLRVGKRIAIMIVVMIMLVTTITMSVEAYRNKFFNMIIDATQEYISVTLDKEKIIDYLYNESIDRFLVFD